MSAPPSLAIEEEKGSKLPWIVIALALFAAVGVGAFLAGRDSGEEDVLAQRGTATSAGSTSTGTSAGTPGTASAGSEEATNAGADPGAANSVARLTISLMSQPSGAMVVVDGEQFGPTPTTVSWEGDRARPGRELSFAFQLEGFQDQTVTRSVEGQQLTVQANLAAVEADEPTPRVTVMRNTRVRMVAPRMGTMTAMRRLNGYKAEPY